MQGFGDVLLADACLAGDEHRNVAPQQLAQLAVDLRHGGRASDDVPRREIELRRIVGGAFSRDVDRLGPRVQQQPENRFEQRSRSVPVRDVADDDQAPGRCRRRGRGGPGNRPAVVQTAARHDRTRGRHFGDRRDGPGQRADLNGIRHLSGGGLDHRLAGAVPVDETRPICAELVHEDRDRLSDIGFGRAHELGGEPIEQRHPLRRLVVGAPRHRLDLGGGLELLAPTAPGAERNGDPGVVGVDSDDIEHRRTEPDPSSLINGLLFDLATVDEGAVLAFEVADGEGSTVDRQ